MTGLILEGGAMRGLFTAGVLEVLMENGIVLDGTIGVSAGAVALIGGGTALLLILKKKRI